MDVSIQEFANGMAWWVMIASILVACWAVGQGIFSIVRGEQGQSPARVAGAAAVGTFGPLLLVCFMLLGPYILLGAFQSEQAMSEGVRTFLLTYWWLPLTWAAVAFVTFLATAFARAWLATQRETFINERGAAL